jgi:hypothetical protein
LNSSQFLFLFLFYRETVIHDRGGRPSVLTLLALSSAPAPLGWTDFTLCGDSSYSTAVTRIQTHTSRIARLNIFHEVTRDGAVQDHSALATEAPPLKPTPPPPSMPTNPPSAYITSYHHARALLSRYPIHASSASPPTPAGVIGDHVQIVSHGTSLGLTLRPRISQSRSRKRPHLRSCQSNSPIAFVLSRHHLPNVSFCRYLLLHLSSLDGW